MQGKTTILTFYLQILMLTLAWFIGTLITLGLGAGTFLTALYKTVFRALREDGEPITLKQFLKDARENIVLPTLFTIVLAGSFVGLYFILTRVSLGGLEYLLYFIGFELALVSLYSFASLATFKFASPVHALKTIGLMANFHGFTTLKVVAVFILTMLSIIYITVYIWPITFALYFMLSALIFNKTFMVYVNRIKKADEIDEENQKNEA